MTRLIDANALYEQIAKKEELARQRVLDTPSRMPNGDFNPSAVRYAAQLDERTQMKFMIADASTIDAVPVIRCKDCARNPNNGKARTICPCPMDRYMGDEGFCSKAELKED